MQEQRAHEVSDFLGELLADAIQSGVPLMPYLILVAPRKRCGPFDHFLAPVLLSSTSSLEHALERTSFREHLFSHKGKWQCSPCFHLPRWIRNMATERLSRCEAQLASFYGNIPLYVVFAHAAGLLFFVASARLYGSVASSTRLVSSGVSPSRRSSRKPISDALYLLSLFYAVRGCIPFCAAFSASARETRAS